MSDTRRYHVIARNDGTGVDAYLTLAPVTHEEACIILRKMPPMRVGRALLVDADGVEPGIVLSTPDADYFRA